MSDNVKTEQRVGIFVDVLNLFYAAKTLHRGSKVDYGRLLASLTEGKVLTRAVAYVIRKPDIDQAGFVSALQHIGFEVKVKELRKFTDRDGRESIDRSSWAVGLTVDALALIPRLDTFVLVSGNSDYLPLIAAVQAAGCKAVVAGIQGSLSSELIKAADGHKVLDTEFMFAGDPKDNREPLPQFQHVGSQYGVDAGDIDDLSDIDEVPRMPVAPVKKSGQLEAKVDGFGILGPTAKESVDKAGLPKD